MILWSDGVLMKTLVSSVLRQNDSREKQSCCYQQHSAAAAQDPIRSSRLFSQLSMRLTLSTNHRAQTRAHQCRLKTCDTKTRMRWRRQVPNGLRLQTSAPDPVDLLPVWDCFYVMTHRSVGLMSHDLLMTLQCIMWHLSGCNRPTSPHANLHQL